MVEADGLNLLSWSQTSARCSMLWRLAWRADPAGSGGDQFCIVRRPSTQGVLVERGLYRGIGHEHVEFVKRLFEGGVVQSLPHDSSHDLQVLS
jgi:hypothetical protein